LSNTDDVGATIEAVEAFGAVEPIEAVGAVETVEAIGVVDAVVEVLLIMLISLSVPEVTVSTSTVIKGTGK